MPVLAVLSSRDAEICHRASPALVDFPAAADRPPYGNGWKWEFTGAAPQGFLIPERTFRHSQAGGFTAVLKVRVEADSSGAAPADAALVALASSDGQVAWRLQSDVAGSWTAVVCAGGVCASTTASDGGPVGLIRRVAVRYRSGPERVDIFVNNMMAATSNSDGVHDMVRFRFACVRTRARVYACIRYSAMSSRGRVGSPSCNCLMCP